MSNACLLTLAKSITSGFPDSLGSLARLLRSKETAPTVARHPVNRELHNHTGASRPTVTLTNRGMLPD
jgi:hypothetical protein